MAHSNAFDRDDDDDFLYGNSPAPEAKIPGPSGKNSVGDVLFLFKNWGAIFDVISQPFNNIILTFCIVRVIRQCLNREFTSRRVNVEVYTHPLARIPQKSQSPYGLVANLEAGAQSMLEEDSTEQDMVQEPEEEAEEDEQGQGDDSEEEDVGCCT